MDKHPLPDTSQWQPRGPAAETLQAAFLKRCEQAELLIQARCNAEIGMNIDNFDAGLGIEDIFRETLQSLLPQRYSVRAGVVVDSLGRTCGDCDVVVFNETWFPFVKPGASSTSRRTFFPIEGVYSVCEIKQSLDIQALDDAMRKLVTCHRLYRPHTFANRLVENRDLDGCFHGLTNPLYSAIIATSLKGSVSMDEIVRRFFDINATLQRLDVVRALCVLGHGTVVWGYRTGNGESKPALFMRDDLFSPIFPVYSQHAKSGSSLFHLITNLLLHMYHSVLGAEDIAVAYGRENLPVSIPKHPSIALAPDPEWLNRLDDVRDHEGKVVRRTKPGTTLD